MHRYIALLALALALVTAQDSDGPLELPTVGMEWFPSNTDPTVSSGIRHLRLQDIYDDPNNNPQEESSGIMRIPKPARGSYVIAVNPGCEAGISVTQLWVMNLRNTADIPNANSEILFFTQDGDFWFSNEAGFLYGFDSSDCTARNFEARVITSDDDPDLVDAVFAADIIASPPGSGPTPEPDSSGSGEQP